MARKAIPVATIAALEKMPLPEGWKMSQISISFVRFADADAPHCKVVIDSFGNPVACVGTTATFGADELRGVREAADVLEAVAAIHPGRKRV